MRALKVTVLAAAAALTLAAAVAPAAAGPHFGGGGHWGGGHGWGHRGWGGPGLVFGLAGAALLAGVAADQCVSWVPTYDDYGNVVGRHPVNAC
jgi:hypothetical protein